MVVGPETYDMQETKIVKEVIEEHSGEGEMISIGTWLC